MLLTQSDIAERDLGRSGFVVGLVVGLVVDGRALDLVRALLVQRHAFLGRAGEEGVLGVDDERGDRADSGRGIKGDRFIVPMSRHAHSQDQVRGDRGQAR